MKYVGLAAVSVTFWLLVATLRVAINGDGQPRREAVETQSPAPEQRPVADNPISKRAVVTGMNAVRPLVHACYERYHVPGMAMVIFVINQDGSVDSATVSGKFAGTPTGACVEHAVKAARFPRSDGFRMPYPFILR